MFILSLGFHWFFSKAIAIIPFGFWLIDAVELKKIVRTFLLWITIDRWHWSDPLSISIFTQLVITAVALIRIFTIRMRFTRGKF